MDALPSSPVSPAQVTPDDDVRAAPALGVDPDDQAWLIVNHPSTVSVDGDSRPVSIVFTETMDAPPSSPVSPAQVAPDDDIQAFWDVVGWSGSDQPQQRDRDRSISGPGWRCTEP